MYFFYFDYFNLAYGKFRDLQYVTLKKNLEKERADPKMG